MVPQRSEDDYPAGKVVLAFLAMGLVPAALVWWLGVKEQGFQTPFFVKR